MRLAKSLKVRIAEELMFDRVGPRKKRKPYIDQLKQSIAVARSRFAIDDERAPGMALYKYGSLMILLVGSVKWTLLS